MGALRGYFCWQVLGVLALTCFFSEAEAARSLSVSENVAQRGGLKFAHYRLATNELEVILHRNTTTPVVAVNIWYHAGPRNEEPGRTGFAHLFEHLMFQGSLHVGDDQHFKLLERAGASQINGTTGNDRTNYFETVPSNQLELALWLESDRMGFLSEALSLESLNNQRDVVMNERRQSIENRPYGPTYEAFIQTVFKPGHPYFGAVIGSMEDLQAASLDDVRQFYERYYAPSNATLVIAGDIDLDATKALVEHYFGSLPARQKPSAKTIVTAPIQKQKRRIVEEPVMLPRIQIGWLSPSFLKKGDAEADILAYILGAGKSSRLYQKLVYEKEWAVSVGARQQSNELASVFSVTVTAQPETDLKALESEVWRLIEETRKEMVTEEEIQRARNILLTQSVGSLQSMGAVADRLNMYNHYSGDPGFLAEDLKRYEEVVASDLSAFANKYLGRDNSVVVTTLPKGRGNQ